MKKTILIIAFFAFAVNAQTKITLEEAIRLGMNKSESLKISESKLKYSEASATEISSQLLPKLQLNASYMRLSDIPSFTIDLPVLPAPVVIQEPVLNTYSVKLSLQQPLFTGFRLSSLKSAAELNREAAKTEFSKGKNEEAFKIINAYWNFYRAKKMVELFDENLTALKAHLNDTREFVGRGLATRNDLLKIEVQYSSVELQKIEAENNYKIAQGVLNKILGYPVTNDMEIIAEQIIPEKYNFSFDALLNTAKNNRPELQTLNFRIDAGEENINAASSNWFPSLFLVSNFYYSRPNQRIFPLQDKFNDTWDVGVALSWDIWNWGYNSAKTEQAEQNVVQLKSALQQVKEAIEMEVYNNFLAVNAALDKVELNKKAVEQSEENYRITDEKYKVQLAASADLIDAEVSYLQAQTYLINSLVEFELAKVKLEKSIGEKLY